MTRHEWPVYSAVAGFATVGLGCLVALWLQAAGYLPRELISPSLRLQINAPGVGPPAAPTSSTPVDATPPLDASPQNGQPAAPEDRYFNQLRSRMRWIETRMGGDKFLTLDLDSRLLLVKSAARRAGLSALGLGFEDVYGIINAETSWIPRTGASKDGTPNLGIAQFEPATARALGIRDPNDPVEAVHAAARHMKEAALWSADHIAGLKLRADERPEKLREGISIYYNLSTRGRNTWTGRNTHQLPRETQLHIQNARLGAQQAEFFDVQLQAMKYRPGGTSQAVATSSEQRGGI